MTSVVHSVLGAALLLTSASAAMAAPNTPPAAGQPVQAGAATASTAPSANQPAQAAAPATTAATNSAPSTDQPKKPPRSGVTDNTDRYGGNDPNSAAGTRAFWSAINPY